MKTHTHKKIFDNYKRATVFHQVLYVNLFLSLVFLIFFAVSNLYTYNKSRKEEEKYSRQIVETMTGNIQEELVRLESFAEVCVEDRSFVLALADKLSVKEFTEYGMDVSEKLLMIRYALPYAENVYAYSKNSQKVIMTQRSILRKELFIEQLEKELKVTEAEIPEFGALSNGFHRIGKVYFYVYQCRDFGTLIIQVDGERFCMMSGSDSVLQDYEIAVLDKEGAFFAGNPKHAGELKKMAGERADTGECRIYRSSMSNGFQVYFLEKNSQAEELQKKNLLIYLAGGALVFVNCILLIFLNISIYRPLQAIARKYRKAGEAENEISLIHGKLEEMAVENTRMQNQILSDVQMQLDIEINYAIYSKRKLSDRLAAQLQEEYGAYRIMTVAMQEQKGGGDEKFAEVDDFFTDSLNSRVFIRNRFLHMYLIAATYEKSEILSSVDQYFGNIKPNIRVFVGISEVSQDFSEIYKVYRQGYDRMLSNKISVERKYAVTSAASGKMISRKISFELMNMITKHTLNGKKEDIKEVFERIFFEDCGLTLGDSISYYNQLAELFITMLHQNQAVLLEEEKYTSLLNVPMYHPVYMYYTLLEAYTELNASVIQKTSSLKYEIVDYIDQHYMEALSLDSISSVFGITSVYLSSWFKKNIGINLSVYISNVRMEAARRILLEERGIKVAEVAERVGISSSSTFIRQFKSHFGCTPDQYRQKMEE